MQFRDWIERRGGIAHTHDALRAGFTGYAIHAAVKASVVRRIRRSWLATPQAPPLLTRAAASGGRLACLTAASHHGLWVLDDEHVHLAAPPNAGHLRSGDALVHWARGPIPTDRYALVEPVINALWQVADCQPFENALAVWESAIRSGHVAIEVLDGLPLRSAAGRMVRSACSQLSDSGLETIPVSRLARIGITVEQQVVIDGRPVDGLIGDRLVLQLDGFSFHRTSEQRRRDIAADRRLRLRGYTVFRYDYQEVLFEWERVELEIRTAIAQELHRGLRTAARSRAVNAAGGDRREGRMRTPQTVLP